MTIQKHLKARVRTRMGKTGERYSTARRHVVQESAPESVDPTTRWHFPGCVPATTALRVLLTHAGVRAPHTGEPFTEAMLFGLAGGIGIGVCAFFYEKECAASFFLAGRHRWFDDDAYLRAASQHLAGEPIVRETSSPKAAEKHLHAALEQGPCIAWVDMAHLPHRGLPEQYQGGGYHVVTVYRITETEALIGDLGQTPLSVPLADLALARARIKKQKHRLLSLPNAGSPVNLKSLVQNGLRVCHQGLQGADAPMQARSMFSPESLRIWGERLHGSKDGQRWERVFAPPRLWRGLLGIYDGIEYFGTGGGLSRPLFALFLSEAADALGDSRLRSLAERYAELGRAWSGLAAAALPQDVPGFREVRDLLARRAALTARGNHPDELRTIWKRLVALDQEKAETFPLSESGCADLRAALQVRVRALYEAEVAAHAVLGQVI